MAFKTEKLLNLPRHQGNENSNHRHYLTPLRFVRTETFDNKETLARMQGHRNSQTDALNGVKIETSTLENGGQNPRVEAMHPPGLASFIPRHVPQGHLYTCGSENKSQNVHCSTLHKSSKQSKCPLKVCGEINFGGWSPEERE